MKKYNVEITEPAENDLLEIRRYIVEELYEAKVAENIINKIACCMRCTYEKSC
jgi:hypothetical protein